MNQSKVSVSQYSLKIAYPTIAMTIVGLAAYVFSTVAAVQGHLGIGWAIPINSLMAYILFTSMHEAGHLNISGNHKSLRWIDEVIGWVSAVTLLAPFYVFKVIHFRHHAFTNDPEKDPDHWLASKSWIALIFHSTTIFPVYIIKAIQLLFFDEKISKNVKRELFIGLVVFVFLILLFIVAGMTIGWRPVLLLWVLPAFIAQGFLAFAFDWLPHHPHEEQARYLNTRVIDIPGLSILLLSQNYHLVHHLYPRVPFYDYEKVYSGMADKLRQKGVKIIGDGASGSK